jgi:hypothetical protein
MRFNNMRPDIQVFRNEELVAVIEVEHTHRRKDWRDFLKANISCIEVSSNPRDYDSNVSLRGKECCQRCRGRPIPDLAFGGIKFKNITAVRRHARTILNRRQRVTNKTGEGSIEQHKE